MPAAARRDKSCAAAQLLFNSNTGSATKRSHVLDHVHEQSHRTRQRHGTRAGRRRTLQGWTTGRSGTRCLAIPFPPFFHPFSSLFLPSCSPLSSGIYVFVYFFWCLPLRRNIFFPAMVYALSNGNIITLDVKRFCCGSGCSSHTFSQPFHVTPFLNFMKCQLNIRKIACRMPCCQQHGHVPRGLFDRMTEELTAMKIRVVAPPTTTFSLLAAHASADGSPASSQRNPRHLRLVRHVCAVSSAEFDANVMLHVPNFHGHLTKALTMSAPSTASRLSELAGIPDSLDLWPSPTATVSGREWYVDVVATVPRTSSTEVRRFAPSLTTFCTGSLRKTQRLGGGQRRGTS